MLPRFAGNLVRSSGGIISRLIGKNKRLLLFQTAVTVPAIVLSVYYHSSASNPSSHLRMSQLVPPQAAPTWQWAPNAIIKDAEGFITKSREFQDSLALLKEPTLDNFVKPFADFENECALLVNQLTFLQHVSADKDVRDASVKATELLQNFEIESSSRRDIFLQFDKIWQSIKPKKDTFPKSEDTANLELFKFVEKSHKDYIRAGLNLAEVEREKVKKIKLQIAANSLEFSKNLGEQKEFVSFTKEELDGVSETVIEQFETFTDSESGQKKYKVTFKYPDIFPVLKTAENPQTRKTAFEADQNKVGQNEPLFLEQLRLRQELARLLGYSTYANYNVELKMAKNQEAVLDFLNDLQKKLEPLGIKEVEILKKLKEKECKELGIPFDNHYYVWDHRYYDNKFLKDNYNVDIEKISEYYPIESAIKGMLRIYETLLKLKFVEETDPSKKSTWHEDVRQLAVWKMDDPDSPQFVGWIYFDLHPRDGKYGHAANFGLAPAYLKKDGTRSYPVTALVCNFSKATKTKPSLLKHNEITTFFHELGHGIHDLVGANRFATFNGPGATPWDFVEAPSQMLEFWTWNKEELSSLSSHYETGEKIPDELLDSLIATKHVNGALFALRQLHFGLFDMTVHTKSDLENLNVLELWNNLRSKIALVENGSSLTRGYNSFGHIMSDSYSAGYYGYMWAEVFAADMYHTKFAANPLDSTVGVQYRDIVLSRGGLYEMKDNLFEFLGREPSKEAFLKELGLSG